MPATWGDVGYSLLLPVLPEHAKAGAWAPALQFGWDSFT